MTFPSDPAREQERLDALAGYNILDTAPEESFDRLTRLARRLFGVEMSTISFLDAHRQWFKSRQGFDAFETDRDSAFCNIAIQQPKPLIVQDATKDETFAQNRFVTGEPHVRFYAGFQRRSPDGYAIGTLCAFDPRPRTFSDDDHQTLADLGGLAGELLALRRRIAEKEAPAKDAANHRVLKAGRIVYGKLAMPCTIRALTAEAATVDVLSTNKIPERVALMIDTDAVSRLCQITARTDRQLMLAFES
ncbi:MAG: hypothetical protein DI537_33635 [Stutzerimonas stutzeri]|nr:MAG: hypothetical protein DI537_33635 [Stutzerimonas stutzeri]